MGPAANINFKMGFGPYLPVSANIEAGMDLTVIPVLELFCNILILVLLCNIVLVQVFPLCDYRAYAYFMQYAVCIKANKH